MQQETTGLAYPYRVVLLQYGGHAVLPRDCILTALSK